MIERVQWKWAAPQDGWLQLNGFDSIVALSQAITHYAASPQHDLNNQLLK